MGSDSGANRKGKLSDDVGDRGRGKIVVDGRVGGDC